MNITTIMNTTKRLIEQLEKLTNKKVILKEEISPITKQHKELEVISLLKSSDSYITLKVMLNGAPAQIEFERDELIERGEAYDEPWTYLFTSTDAPNGKKYSVGCSLFGHPDTNFEFSEVEDSFIEEV